MLYKRFKRKTNLRSPIEPSTFSRYRENPTFIKKLKKKTNAK